MSFKKILVLVVSMKALLVVLCLSLTFIGYIASQVWFLNQATSTQKINALRNAPQVEVDQRNEKGQTGLMVAASTGNLPLVKLFVERGADINAQAKTTKLNLSGNTPLLLALFNSNIGDALNVAKYLIEAGADVNQPNNNGDRPIQALMQINNVTGPSRRKEVLEWLLDAYADINAQNRQGNTMLHLTVELDDIEWMKYIYQKYNSMIDWKLKNKKGFTVYEFILNLERIGYASLQEVLQGRAKIVGEEPLIGYQQTGNRGRNGLMFAILRGDKKFAEKMVSEGTNVNLKDKLGNTAFFYAVISDDPKWFIDFLLKQGAQANVVNNAGETPLFLVPLMLKTFNQAPIADILLKNGVPIDKKNNKGETVADIAKRYHLKSLADYLENASKILK